MGNEIDEALILEHAGDYKGALEYYRLWLSKSGQSDVPNSKYNDILIHISGLMDKPEQYLDFLDYCLEKDPVDSKKQLILRNMGEINILLGRYDAASKSYKRAAFAIENDADYAILLTAYKLEFKTGSYGYLEELKTPMSRIKGPLLTEYANLHAATLYQLGYGLKALSLLQKLSNLESFEPDMEFHRLMLFLFEQNGKSTDAYMQKLISKERESLELKINSGELLMLTAPGDIIPLFHSDD